MNRLLALLRHHVTGAIERGEKEPVVEVRDGPVMGRVPYQPEPVRFADKATAIAYGVTDYWPVDD